MTTKRTKRRKPAVPKRAAMGVWGENKERYNLNLTPTVVSWLDQQAEQERISRSEYLERLLRGVMEGSWDLTPQDLTDLKKRSA